MSDPDYHVQNFGVYNDISNEDYHATKEVQGLPAFSSTFCKTFA